MPCSTVWLTSTRRRARIPVSLLVANGLPLLYNPVADPPGSPDSLKEKEHEETPIVRCSRSPGAAGLAGREGPGQERAAGRPTPQGGARGGPAVQRQRPGRLGGAREVLVG